MAERIAALLDPVAPVATDSNAVNRSISHSSRQESPADSRRGLFSDRRGAVTTEYVVLVGTVGLAVVFALVTVGPRLVKDFQRARNITAAPIP